MPQRTRTANRRLQAELRTALRQPVSDLLTTLAKAEEAPVPALGSDAFAQLVEKPTLLTEVITVVVKRGGGVLEPVFGSGKFASLTLRGRRRRHVIRDVITSAHAQAQQRQYATAARA